MYRSKVIKKFLISKNDPRIKDNKDHLWICSHDHLNRIIKNINKYITAVPRWFRGGVEEYKQLIIASAIRKFNYKIGNLTIVEIIEEIKDRTVQK